jgi:predicted enzyme related to lactoylglutathione lyase
MSDNSQVGKIGWIDMTVDDADGIRDFYKAVVGWGSETVSMGDYSDYSMTMPENSEAVSGICHSRGSNADLPSGWLIYIVVDDVEASAGACVENGGEVIVPVKGLAGGRFCVIRDPAGSTAALYQP